VAEPHAAAEDAGAEEAAADEGEEAPAAPDADVATQPGNRTAEVTEEDSK
jgi:hypothetical protein